MNKGLKFRGLVAAALVAGCVGVFSLITAGGSSSGDTAAPARPSSKVTSLNKSSDSDLLARNYRRVVRRQNRRVA